MLDFNYKKDKENYIETSVKGKALLRTTQLNKGSAFTAEERDIFGLVGKLPNHIETLDQQIERAYLQYSSYQEPINQNIFLNELHDTNQVLFYALVKKHLREMLPIIYTPTVGLAVQNFSKKFQHARGLYITYEDQEHIEEILDNRSNPEIDLIVVTDGSGVLGIGDQGVGAMMIPVAKLMVYGLCGGINPLRTLPILLDVGTNNQTLRDDPLYLGCKHDRITGEKYNAFIEKFVTAIKHKFPEVFLHWEDFDRNHARQILNRYQHKLCTFNDDIQGTGVATLSALISAVNANKSNLAEQRIVIFGAGTAGTGIADQIAQAMVHEGLSIEEAHNKFWLIDRFGLLTDDMPDLTPAQQHYTRSDWKEKEKQLLDVIKAIKPTVLIGCSAVPNAFNKKIIKKMTAQVDHPIIFPLSNPTSRAEAVPSDLIHWTKAKARIATGSPFAPVEYKGKTIRIALCNNALVFPGIGLGLISAKAKHLNAKMLYAASKALAEASPSQKNPSAPLLPPIEEAEKMAKTIAQAVAESAIEQGESTCSLSEVKTTIENNFWQPRYVKFKRIKR